MSCRLNPKTLLVVGVLGACLGAALAWACGPFFPNRLLVNGDATLTWAPVADFEVEMRRLVPAAPPFPAVPPPEQFREADYYRQTMEADRADLKAALENAKVPPDRRDGLLAEQETLRRGMALPGSRADQVVTPTTTRRSTSTQPTLSLPDGLPPEFAYYLRGAAAWYRDETEAARRAWEDVLALPAEQRHYRSTWAAFMLGRSWLDSDPAKAVECFRQVRALAGSGFADSIGLASASLGWEARAELNADRLERATELYLAQLATDDPTATWSLRLVAVQVVKEGNAGLRRAAADDNLRRVITAYLLARGGPVQSVQENPPASLTEEWLKILESTKVKDVAGADRLAWAAYQAGAFAAAERWVKVAPESSPIGHWIKAKLLLRAGKINEAAKQLALAAKGFPPDEEWTDLNMDFEDWGEEPSISPGKRALGELGVLRLGRRQYVDALDALARADYWMDAAYVAERVLTLDELVEYVDRNWPAVSPEIEKAVLGVGEDYPVYDEKEGEEVFRQKVQELERAREQREALSAMGRTNVLLRHLLARRLARAERWSQARAYCPRCYLDRLTEYAENLRRGRSESPPKADRAAALWKAAKLARYSGMELLGTELEPDWSVLGGDFQLDETAKERAKKPGGKLAAATPDEQARTQRSAAKPPKRWHYRYLAADLAWQAAELMPDESEETARALCEAGSWLKDRDPDAALRFYKALVRRCGNTESGREAKRLHWFPKVADRGEE